MRLYPKIIYYGLHVFPDMGNVFLYRLQLHFETILDLLVHYLAELTQIIFCQHQTPCYHQLDVKYIQSGP